jgi:hypothetical protein
MNTNWQVNKVYYLFNTFITGNMELIPIDYPQIPCSVLSDIRQHNSVNIKR